MNFKITKTKLIASLVIAAITGFLFVYYISINTFYSPCPQYNLNCGGTQPNALSIKSFFISFLLNFLIVYFIWSLFQKSNGQKSGIRSIIIGLIIILILVALIAVALVGIVKG